MRSFKEFSIDIVRKPPMLFPLVGLFHVLWLIVTIVNALKSLSGIYLPQVLWFAGYTFFWIAACDLRKWGVFGYILLSLASLLIFFAAKKHTISDYYVSDLRGIDILFCFCLLVFYKKLRS